MNLENSISQLLYRFPCVTVPNFGAFVTEIISANIQETTQTLHPPKKVISFNSYIKNNDGLLANHIATNQKITHQEALSKINEQVIAWKEKLQNNEVVVLNKIGSFRSSIENNLLFEPSNHTNYLTQSFGLTPVISPVIKREVAQHLKIEKTVAPIQSQNFETDFEYEESRFSVLKLLKYAAVFFVSLGGLAFGYATYIQQQETQETLVMQAQVQKEVNAKIQEATFLISSPKIEIETLQNERSKPFHIIAGAFRNINNAEKEMQNLTQKGFNSVILNKNNQDLHPVAFQSYATYSEAQQNLEKAKKINPDAWIFINVN